MDVVNNILGGEEDDNTVNWVVEFEGGYTVIVPANKKDSRDKVMMMARRIQSDTHRYDFEGRRASGGRIIRCYRQ